MTEFSNLDICCGKPQFLKRTIFFLYFCLFNTVDSKKCPVSILTKTGFEPQTSGVGGDRSTNWATTTVQILSLSLSLHRFLSSLFLYSFQHNSTLHNEAATPFQIVSQRLPKLKLFANFCSHSSCVFKWAISRHLFLLFCLFNNFQKIGTCSVEFANDRF